MKRSLALLLLLFGSAATASSQNSAPSVDEVFSNAESGVYVANSPVAVKYVDRLIGIDILTEHNSEFENAASKAGEALAMPSTLNVSFDTMAMTLTRMLYADFMQYAWALPKDDLVFALNRNTELVKKIEEANPNGCIYVEYFDLTIAMYQDGNTENEDRWREVLINIRKLHNQLTEDEMLQVREERAGKLDLQQFVDEDREVPTDITEAAKMTCEFYIKLNSEFVHVLEAEP